VLQVNLTNVPFSPTKGNRNVVNVF